MRQRLLRLPDVAKVELFGVQPEKLFVEIPQKRLAQLGLDMSQVIAQLGAQNAVEGAGVLNAGSQNLQVRIGGQFNTVEELARLPIRAVNPTTGCGEHDPPGRHRRDPSRLRRSAGGDGAPPGREVIALGVAMAKGGDIIDLGKSLRVATEAIQRELPLGITLERMQDQPAAVARSVGEFIGVLTEAVIIVLVVSFLSLGLHLKPLRIDIWPGLVVAITIPLVLAITFVTMFYWGVGLHKISLGSLIIALGLLVDDAIIAVEMMVRKLEEGYDKIRAATFAYDVTAMPMLTGTLITATGFLPIGMAKSVTGEYTFAIFAVTSAALLISWVVSVYFVPYLGAWLLRTRPKISGMDGPHELFDTPFYTRFRSAVDWCVRHRWITIGLTLATFAAGLAGMGKVQQQFFPGLEPARDPGRPVAPRRLDHRADRRDRARFEARMMREPGVASVSSWIGSGCPASTCRWTRSSRRPTSARRSSCRATTAREALRMRLPALLADEFPGGARARQVAAQRPAGAVPGAVPRRRRERDRGARMGRPGEGTPARQPEHARRQRQLERADQGAAPGDRPGQGARARRDQPGDRAGVADHPLGEHDRAVPRGRQAGRHRAPPARRGAQRDHRHRQRLHADLQRPQRAADADRQRSSSAGSRGSCGARTATTRSPSRATSRRACRARP